MSPQWQFRTLGLLLVVVLNLVYLFRDMTYIWNINLSFQYRKVEEEANVKASVSMSALDSSKNQGQDFSSIRNDTNRPSFYTILDPVPNRKIDKIRILGERHSGTTYLTRYLQGCFSDQQITDTLIRGKHWFQPSPQAMIKAANAMGDMETMVNSNVSNISIKFLSIQSQLSWWETTRLPNLDSIFSNSFILYLVRDPYQWLEAMRRKPWHWPNHLTILPVNETKIATMKYDRERREIGKRRMLQSMVPDDLRRVVSAPPDGPVRIQKSYVTYETLDWDQFVQIPLRLADEDEPATNNHTVQICRNGFPNGTISPCLETRSYVPPLVRHIPKSFLRHLPLDVNNVVYELQLNGQAFDHPLALRARKIQNILKLPHVWDLGGFTVLRYEDLLNSNDNGAMLEGLVKDLEGVLGIKSHCRPHERLIKKPYSLPTEFMDWIDEHAIWEIEQRIGYTHGRNVSDSE